MKSGFMTLMLFVVFGLAACQAESAQLSTSITATPETVNFVVSPVQQTQTDKPGLAETPPPVVDNTEPVRIDTLAEAEKLVDFKLQEPAYLPEGVSFAFAAYQQTTNPSVALYFKIIHPQFGDMGPFFQILQEPQAKAPPDIASCVESKDGICELLQIGEIPVVYHQYSAGTEGLDWFHNGCTYRLLRMAGEPGKVYKDELVKVVASLK
jgi:hypothetical protein